MMKIHQMMVVTAPVLLVIMALMMIRLMTLMMKMVLIAKDSCCR